MIIYCDNIVYVTSWEQYNNSQPRLFY